jgi:hypothetical protein
MRRLCRTPALAAMGAGLVAAVSTSRAAVGIDLGGSRTLKLTSLKISKINKLHGHISVTI